MDPSQVVNGEEEEECMHRVRGKLFRLAKKEWCEMGIGVMKVSRKLIGRGGKRGGGGVGGCFCVKGNPKPGWLIGACSRPQSMCVYSLVGVSD